MAVILRQRIVYESMKLCCRYSWYGGQFVYVKRVGGDIFGEAEVNSPESRAWILISWSSLTFGSIRARVPYHMVRDPYFMHELPEASQTYVDTDTNVTSGHYCFDNAFYLTLFFVLRDPFLS